MRYFPVLICCSTWVLSTANGDLTSTPRIIIVGAGSFGIADTSKLFENGFTNVEILEAENRIGGRIHSIKLGKSPLSKKILEDLINIEATLDNFQNIDLSNLKSGSLGEFIDAK
ncbi:hypothetical protein PV328_003935 [Microctonus aethiopoides]|uniref:Amine oxidase domain-containing protein n=1 Tax=Microctonus aethiopoides TaxID=144406 RepID=A0AA39F9G8_9HYME|nr:hypothetical protein PV328_003935 [Microctonus aethiopoides]